MNASATLLRVYRRLRWLAATAHAWAESGGGEFYARARRLGWFGGISRFRRTLEPFDDAVLAAWRDSSHAIREPTKGEEADVAIVIVDDGDDAGLRSTVANAMDLRIAPGELSIVRYGAGALAAEDKWNPRIPGVALQMAEAWHEAERCIDRVAQMTRARHLLLLRSGVSLLPGGLETAIALLHDDPQAGAVAARVIDLDGRTVSAGLDRQSDGTLGERAREGSAWRSYTLCRRQVDACTEHFMLVQARDFKRLGGLGQTVRDRPAPSVAVADLCLRLRELGHHVVYSPAVAVKTERKEHRSRSLRLDTLEDRLWGRDGSMSRRRLPRVLYVDDAVPTLRRGHGLPRAWQLVHGLLGWGCEVAVLPTIDDAVALRDVVGECDPRLEIILGVGHRRFRWFWLQRARTFDLVVASRSGNLELVRISAGDRSPQQRPKIVYDCEALLAPRLSSRERINGVPVSAETQERRMRSEIEKSLDCSAVIAVSEQEAQEFRQRGVAPVLVVGHAVDVCPTTNHFSSRDAFLFVGGFEETWHHNYDGLRWFVTDVWPHITRRLGTPSARLRIVGRPPAERPTWLCHPEIDVLGEVEDLVPEYAAARVFVAPVRIAAGIPLKVLHAAANGVPIVLTPTLAAQLGWQDELDVLAEDTPHGFAEACIRLYHDQVLWERLRGTAIRRVRDGFSREKLLEQLRTVLDAVA